MSSKAVLLFVSAFISASTVFANYECSGEAQINAKVTSIRELSKYTCVVNVAIEKADDYNSNVLCPLDEMEVLSQGVDVGLKNSGLCTYQPGDSISGYVMKDEEGAIIFNGVY